MIASLVDAKSCFISDTSYFTSGTSSLTLWRLVSRPPTHISDILHICIVLTLHSCMIWSFRLGIVHFNFLFALHKSLSGVGVSIGVLRGTWKHLGSKREWKVLFELVEHRIGQQERPTTPAPDETKAARHPAARFGTRSERCILVDEL